MARVSRIRASDVAGKWLGLFVLALAFFATLAPPTSTAATLDDIRARGILRCGINHITGQAIQSEDGKWSGFMYDMCRAIAAAVLGDANSVEVVKVEGPTRFPALQRGDVDLLTEGTTWTLGRETDLGFQFPATYLYDGQGFLVTKSSGITDITTLKQGRICVARNTTTSSNLKDYLAEKKLPLEALVLESDAGAWDAFLKGRCDIYTDDRVSLAARRVNETPSPDDFVVLPGVISKEPLGPAIRGGDTQWFNTVRWVIYCLIAAEEYGVTSDNLDSLTSSDNSQILALIGKSEDHAKALGLQPGWMRRVIGQVGNYSQVFERNYGKGSALGLDRGLNALWTQGGLMYAPPLY